MLLLATTDGSMGYFGRRALHCISYSKNHDNHIRLLWPALESLLFSPTLSLGFFFSASKTPPHNASCSLVGGPMWEPSIRIILCCPDPLASPPLLSAGGLGLLPVWGLSLDRSQSKYDFCCCCSCMALKALHDLVPPSLTNVFSLPSRLSSFHWQKLPLETLPLKSVSLLKPQIPYF